MGTQQRDGRLSSPSPLDALSPHQGAALGKAGLRVRLTPALGKFPGCEGGPCSPFLWLGTRCWTFLPRRGGSLSTSRFVTPGLLYNLKQALCPLWTSVSLSVTFGLGLVLEGEVINSLNRNCLEQGPLMAPWWPRA